MIDDLMKHRAVIGRKILILYPYTQITSVMHITYLYNRNRASKNTHHYRYQIGSPKTNAVDLGNNLLSTREVATGI